MRLKALIMLAGSLTLNSTIYGQGGKYHVIIGNNTGIHVYDFDAQTGNMNFKSKNTENSAGYFTVASDRKHIYSASSAATISAYRYNSTTGQLDFINKQPTGGGGSAYVSTDVSGKYVFSASYGGGSLSALPIQPDGSLASDVQVIKHEGRSVDKARQDKPYVHSIVVSPDNRYVITADLGTDKMNIYRFDAEKRPSPLTPASQPFVTVDPGSGPRHSTFHPNKKFFYVVNEVNSKMEAFSYKEGNLAHLQTVPMLPDGYTAIGEAADIHVSPDGKFLYGTTRMDVNEVVIYSINKRTGKLTFVGREPSLGRESRTFAIDPAGNFIVLTNQESNSIIIFRRDKKTGLLTPTGQKLEISRPSCVKFVKID